MCLAIPGQIIEMSAEQPLLARVNVGGVQRNVNIGLLEDGEAGPGDWILIHVGFALSKIDEVASGGSTANAARDGRRSARDGRGARLRVRGGSRRAR